MITFLWACTPSPDVEIWAKTTDQHVRIILESISLRATGMDWYQDWHYLEPVSEEISISPKYQLIATGRKEHGEYLHFFLDAHSAFLNETELTDVLEPIALNEPLSQKQNLIYVESIVLDATQGPSIFLINATVQ